MRSLKARFFFRSFSAGKFHIFKQPVKLFQNREMLFLRLASVLDFGK